MNYKDYLRYAKFFSDLKLGYLAGIYENCVYGQFIAKKIYVKLSFNDFAKFCMILYPTLYAFITLNMLPKCFLNIFYPFCYKNKMFITNADRKKIIEASIVCLVGATAFLPGGHE